MKRIVSYFFPTFLVATVLFVACKTGVQNENSQLTLNDSSWAMTSFIKMDSVNPILIPGMNKFTCPILKKEIVWDDKDVFNPAAVVRDNKVYLLFRAEDKIGKYAGTSRIGLAESSDGLHFSKMSTPVLFPAEDSLKSYEWEGGVEDPRVIESEDGRYIMTYTAYDGKTARLLIATSTDLIHWEKHGLVLQGKYKNQWSKSGAIISKQVGSRIVGQKINGEYWMYFGDTDLFLCKSSDLIHWTPIEEGGKLKSVLKPRPGKFDSRLVESGPYALLTGDGVLLIYNSMNLDSGGDEHIPKGAYCAGQVLFDKNDPTKILKRLNQYFMKPDKNYEIEGQVNQVCFLEGLVYFNQKWFMYYGTADSKIAVAVQ